MKIIITPTESWAFELSEFIKSRHLLYFFTWRNFIIRYKQTVLGSTWAVLKPLITMIIYVGIFSRITTLASQTDVPYPVFMFTGLLYWNFFAQSTNMVSGSLLAYQGIIKKIYFPRLIVPISTALTGLVDFLLSFILFLVLLLIFNTSISGLGILITPFLMLMTLLSVFGLGLLSSAINIRYRDVQQILPFILQLAVFLTPVIYSRNILPEEFQWILFINPMSGVIEMARAVYFEGGSLPSMFNFSISVVSMFCLLIIGLIVFKRQERNLSDLV